MAEVNDENFNQILKEIEEEESGGSTKASEESTDVTASAEGSEEHDGEVDDDKASKKEEKKETNPDAEYYPHIGIMEDEGIDRKELPKDIQDMISTFNRKKKMAEVRGAKETTFLQIRNLSAIIADRIMDWLERDLDVDDIDDEEPTKKKAEGGSVDDDDDDVMDTEVDLEEGGSAGGDSSESSDKSSEGGIFGGILGGIFDW